MEIPGGLGGGQVCVRRAPVADSSGWGDHRDGAGTGTDQDSNSGNSGKMVEAGGVEMGEGAQKRSRDRIQN